MMTATGITTKTGATMTGANKNAHSMLKQAQRAASLFAQISDPTRLQIILMLSEGERHVGSLIESLNQNQPVVTHHLALLRYGNLIVPRRQGKQIFYALTEAGKQLASIIKNVIG